MADFTDTISVTTAGVTLTKGATAGSGVIPNTIRVRAYTIWAETGTNTFTITGPHADSATVLVPAGAAYRREQRLQGTWELGLPTITSSAGTVNICIDIEGD